MQKEYQNVLHEVVRLLRQGKGEEIVNILDVSDEYLDEIMNAIDADNLSEERLRQLYEIERTLSALLQTATYIPALIKSSDTLKAMIHDIEGTRNQLRDFMRASGYKTAF